MSTRTLILGLSIGLFAVVGVWVWTTLAAARGERDRANARADVVGVELGELRTANASCAGTIATMRTSIEGWQHAAEIERARVDRAIVEARRAGVALSELASTVAQRRAPSGLACEARTVVVAAEADAFMGELIRRADAR